MGKTGLRLMAIAMFAVLPACGSAEEPAQALAPEQSLPVIGGLGMLLGIAVWMQCGTPVAIQYLYQGGIAVTTQDAATFAEELLDVVVAETAGIKVMGIELQQTCLEA